MSHVAFDFLSDSLLFDQEHIATKYADVSDAELWTELEKYRAHVLAREEDLLAETAGVEGALSVYFDTSSRALPTVDLLKQCRAVLRQGSYRRPDLSAHSATHGFRRGIWRVPRLIGSGIEPGWPLVIRGVHALGAVDDGRTVPQVRANQCRPGASRQDPDHLFSHSLRRADPHRIKGVGSSARPNHNAAAL